MKSFVERASARTFFIFKSAYKVKLETYSVAAL